MTLRCVRKERECWTVRVAIHAHVTSGTVHGSMPHCLPAHDIARAWTHAHTCAHERDWPVKHKLTAHDTLQSMQLLVHTHTTSHTRVTVKSAGSYLLACFDSSHQHFTT
jgi:hypothetical protein